jgi:hypothetical protein
MEKTHNTPLVLGVDTELDMDTKLLGCLCGPTMILAGHLSGLLRFRCFFDVQQYSRVCIYRFYHTIDYMF